MSPIALRVICVIIGMATSRACRRCRASSRAACEAQRRAPVNYVVSLFPITRHLIVPLGEVTALRRAASRRVLCVSSAARERQRHAPRLVFATPPRRASPPTRSAVQPREEVHVPLFSLPIIPSWPLPLHFLTSHPVADRFPLSFVPLPARSLAAQSTRAKGEKTNRAHTDCVVNRRRLCDRRGRLSAHHSPPPAAAEPNVSGFVTSASPPWIFPLRRRADLMRLLLPGAAVVAAVRARAAPPPAQAPPRRLRPHLRRHRRRVPTLWQALLLLLVAVAAASMLMVTACRYV
jgi:hypothetical protein